MSTPMSSEHGLRSLPGHFHGFALMHIAMRRDAQRLLAAAPVLTSAGLGPAGVWWQQLRDIIDWHHRSEDDVLWPGLLRTAPEFAAEARLLGEDHAVLDRAMDAVTSALRGDAPVVTAATRFGSVLRDHLRDEEAVSFPVFARLSPDEYLAVERKVIASAPLKVMSSLQPWMFDGADRRSVAQVAATIPPPVRLIGNTVLRRRYERTLAGVTRPS
ncbi:hemerythrin domain-containing protein [Streptomyces sp. AK02-01A]|uniref:hemerythrin domain-containing protein n=1 Tax=Streptomyces sp. AK02-01A TaxID=3028648 RepID=UPI0029A03929|nr:hemerythrin domain-containing protein [Streptomyces sp. AK02-01A]MDX3850034.1 hemerythrin domain-containing protein [Streptomyces sp. AK02-01A]